MPLGGLVSVGMGAMSIGKYAAAKNRANKDRELAARQIQLSPYTGRQSFQEVNDPNLFDAVAGGAQSGLMTADQFGAFGTPATTTQPTGGGTGTVSGGGMGKFAMLSQPTTPQPGRQQQFVSRYGSSYRPRNEGYGIME